MASRSPIRRKPLRLSKPSRKKSTNSKRASHPAPRPKGEPSMTKNKHEDSELPREPELPRAPEPPPAIVKQDVITDPVDIIVTGPDRQQFFPMTVQGPLAFRMWADGQWVEQVGEQDDKRLFVPSPR